MISVTTTLEIEAFHDVSAVPGVEHRTLAVTLGIAPEAGTKQVFEDFLAVLPDVRFFAYRVHKPLGGPMELQRSIELAVEDQAWGRPAGLSGQLVPWLERRSSNTWSIGAALAEGEVVELSALAAPHLVDAASSWDAPLPQRAGLVRLVGLSGMAVDLTDLVIVPWFKANGEPDRVLEIAGAPAHLGDMPFEVPLRGQPIDPTGDLALQLRRVPQPSADPTSLVDEASGFIIRRRAKMSAEHAAEADGAVDRALKRLRDGGGTQLWAFPELLNLDTVLLPLASNADGTPKPLIDDDLARALWLGATGLAVLLDPVLIGLTMAGTRREGPFLGALGALLEAANGGDLDGVELPQGWCFRVSTIADELTSKVLTAVGAGPADFVKALVAAFEFGPLPSETEFSTSAELLPVLLAIHAGADKTKFDYGAAVERFGVSLDRQVLTELSVLATLAQDETAIEGTAKRLLRHVGLTSEWLAARIERPMPGHDGDAALAEARAAAAIAAFWQFLDSGFNGLEASRQAMAALFEAAIIKDAQSRARAAGTPWDADGLKASLIASNWYATRLGIEGATATARQAEDFATFAATLPKPGAAALAQTDLVSISKALSERLKIVADSLFPEAEKRRFVPDSVPQDLPIRIAVDADDSDGDRFEARFNGVALLVRRDNQTWRYANLAELKLSDPAEPMIETIHPLQPMPVDGQRRLIVSYQGLPLASRSFEAVQVVAPDPDHAAEGFYGIDDPALAMAPDRRLTPLAYGVPVEIAAHVVMKSGSLPRAVRQDRTPWLPRAEVDGAHVPETAVLRFRYQRQTAIGGAALSEAPSTGTVPRIGAGLADVVPLAADYPRATLATGSGSTIRDLLRNEDGTGSIDLGQDGLRLAAYEMQITEIWKTGAGGTLTVGLWNAPAATLADAGLAQQAFDLGPAFAGGTLLVRISIKDDRRVVRFLLSQGEGRAAVVGDAFPLPDGEQLPAWVRLGLTGQEVAVSWAAPESREVIGRPKQKQGNLVLLAPEDARFRPDLARPVKAVIGFPKVGFLDFDRWLANAYARKRAFPDSGTSGSGDETARSFQLLAMTAYLGRHKNKDLAALVDAMPDLAVGGLRLTLAAEDNLGDPTPAPAPVSIDIAIPPLGKWPQLSDLTPRGAEISNVHRTLRRLSDARTVTVTMTVGPKLRLDRIKGNGTPDEITVSVPPGLVARLSIQTLVDEAWFGEGEDQQPVPMLHAQLTQLATGKADGVYLFDGPSLQIEAMQIDDKREDHWFAVARAAVRVSSDGEARSYGLVAAAPRDAELARSWRRLGSIVINTQRWRFTGRPIYSWFDPQNGKRAAQPAVEIDSKAKGLDAFEAEAFFERDAADAVSTLKQIEPAPAETRLETFAWEQPSATLFRHRVLLRSRYAGALRATTLGEWHGLAAPDWLRVAILADATRVQLARPQLRALLPLTESPTQAGVENESPPVLAILEERPFAYGGLADRVAAELRTGFGYGFPKDGLEAPVSVYSSRKEVGPDPRLSYDPTAHERALGLTMATEGPIGLTFDSPTVPAPAFPNSAMLLRPRFAERAGAGAGALEEHFLGVALRRYLDPRWLIDRQERDAAALPINTPHWAVFMADLGLSPVEPGKEVPVLSVGSEPILWLERTAGAWTAKVAAARLVPGSTDAVTIATARVDFAPKLGLLHMPLEEGRASLTLFALPGAVEADGILIGGGSHPHVLASFDWNVPDGSKALTLRDVESVTGTAASALTQMTWTRTGRAFDLLEVRRADGSAARLHAACLQGQLAEGKLTLSEAPSTTPLHLLPDLARDPLFVHQHVALLTTAAGDGRGRAMERFGTIRRVLGAATTIGEDVSAVRVVTIETLARPLGTLADKDVAEFDLMAIRPLGDLPTGLSFSYRPLGDSNSKRLPTKLVFSFNGGPSFTVAGTGATNMNQLAAVHFALTTVPAGKATVQWRAVLDDGTSTDGSSDVLALDMPVLLARETVAVKVAVTPDDEFWGDMSMLTLRDKEGLEAFSWDWLFTDASVLEAREAVTASELRKMPDAEARIISVSPPIPVMRDGRPADHPG